MTDEDETEKRRRKAEREGKEEGSDDPSCHPGCAGACLPWHGPVFLQDISSSIQKSMDTEFSAQTVSAVESYMEDRSRTTS